MSLNTLKAVGVMALMVVLSGNMLRLRYQQHELDVLCTQNIQPRWLAYCEPEINIDPGQ